MPPEKMFGSNRVGRESEGDIFKGENKNDDDKFFDELDDKYVEYENSFKRGTMNKSRRVGKDHPGARRGFNKTK